MTEVCPRTGWVLVERAQDPREVKGFVVPDTAKDRALGPWAAYQATVVAVGPPGYRYEPKSKVKRRWCQPDLEPGDTVIVEATSKHPWGERQLLVRCEDVIATLHGVDIEPTALAGHQPYLGKGAEQAAMAFDAEEAERDRIDYIRRMQARR